MLRYRAHKRCEPEVSVAKSDEFTADTSGMPRAALGARPRGPHPCRQRPRRGLTRDIGVAGSNKQPQTPHFHDLSIE